MMYMMYIMYITVGSLSLVAYTSISPLLIENGLGLFVFKNLNSGLVVFKLVLICFTSFYLDLEHVLI